MGCCGQGRQALREAAPAAIGAATTPLTTGDRSERRVLVRYRASAPVVVRGVGSGRLYEFDASRPSAYVSEVDAAALLRSRHFVRGD
jgi:hypothetical protein